MLTTLTGRRGGLPPPVDEPGRGTLRKTTARHSTYTTIALGLIAAQPCGTGQGRRLRRRRPGVHRGHHPTRRPTGLARTALRLWKSRAMSSAAVSLHAAGHPADNNRQGFSGMAATDAVSGPDHYEAQGDGDIGAMSTVPTWQCARAALHDGLGMWRRPLSWIPGHSANRVPLRTEGTYHNRGGTYRHIQQLHTVWRQGPPSKYFGLTGGSYCGAH